MPYTINKYNGEQISVVADGTIDNTTDLKLIGKNYAGYGEVQNENFLFLLENFANTTPPLRPLAGQIWYDLSTRKLKVYDKTNLKWRTTGGAESSGTEPTGLTLGDFWFDTTNKQLYAYNGSTYTLIGPQGVAGAGTTQLKSVSVRDSVGGTHPIIQAVVGDVTVFTISKDDTFTLDDTANPITGFTKIRKGITLAYTLADDGVTTSEHKFFGTASNALKLNGYSASDFVRSTNTNFSQEVVFADVGFKVGETPKLRVFNSSNTTPTIQNVLNDTIVFQTTSGGTTRTPLKLVGNDILPGADNLTDIGASGTKIKTVHAYTFSGTATQAGSLQVGTDFRTASDVSGTGTVVVRTSSVETINGVSIPVGSIKGAYFVGTATTSLKSDTLQVGSEYKTASVSVSSGTIVARTSTVETINGITIPVGSIKGDYFVGTATSANYADLAELYLPDAEYDVGTVLAVGGEKEVTACSIGHRAIGVVSEKPAYLMNKDLVGGVAVALKGRVPVKVIGAVKKGDRLVAANDGVAVVTGGHANDVFGVALESSDNPGVKLVEAVIL